MHSFTFFIIIEKNINRNKLYSYSVVMSEKKEIVCRHIGCRKIFTWRIQRDRHEKKCEKQKPEVKKLFQKSSDGFLCLKCNIVFKHRNNIYRHQQYCKGNKEQKSELKCKFCEKTFKYQSKLSRHEQIHSQESEHQCQACRKVFKRQSNLSKHICTETDNILNPTFGNSDDFVPSFAVNSQLEQLEIVNKSFSLPSLDNSEQLLDTNNQLLDESTYSTEFSDAHKEGENDFCINDTVSSTQEYQNETSVIILPDDYEREEAGLSPYKEEGYEISNQSRWASYQRSKRASLLVQKTIETLTPKEKVQVLKKTVNMDVSNISDEVSFPDCKLNYEGKVCESFILFLKHLQKYRISSHICIKQ